MFELAQQKKNVVITTSTASGKTLSFLLPVLQTILHDPQARALFIYPTKALASDQLRAIKPIIEHFGKDRVFDRDKVTMVIDHFVPNKDIKAAEQCKMCRDFCCEKGYNPFL